MYEGRPGAEHLANVLYDHIDNKNAMETLSRVLDYPEEQLKQDIDAMYLLTGSSITTSSLKGYVTSACMDLGLDKEKIKSLVANLDQTIENMAEDEAILYYKDHQF